MTHNIDDDVDAMFESIIGLMISDTCFSKDDSSNLIVSINWTALRSVSINEAVSLFRLTDIIPIKSYIVSPYKVEQELYNI